jgi:hypothetical protein
MPVTRPVIEGFYHFVNQIDQARKNKINLN